MVDKSFKRLRQAYRSFFKCDITIDHIIPKSREGCSQNEFNVFPFENSRHGAWHTLFWNMTIFEVWDWLEDIHILIFHSKQNKICPTWFSVCSLDTGSPNKIMRFEKAKKKFLTTLILVNQFQQEWFHCFGSSDPKVAKAFLKYKMFFMIFGSKMIDNKFLLSDSNFIKMIQESANYPSRAQAVINCFGSEMPLLPKARAIFNEIELSANPR